MTDLEQENEKHTFQADIQQLLHLLIHSLYVDKDVFLRELISNATDALSRLRILRLTDDTLTSNSEGGNDDDLGIWIETDTEKAIVRVRDSGVGMTREELIENLGTIAHSGTVEFLREASKEQISSLDFIGQFGVGFYSTFMVADKIEIRTKSCIAGAPACSWVSDGISEYNITSIDKEETGTEIILHLRDEEKGYADDYQLRSIIKKHSDFVQFPIHMGDEIVNSRTAIWRKSTSEIESEEYASFYKTLSFDFQDPLSRLHFAVEGHVGFKALLFFPRSRPPFFNPADKEWGPKLYSKNVLIQEHAKDVIPEYFRFLHGIVDSEDIPLNISRESVQMDTALRQIKKVMTGRIIRHLQHMAKEEEDNYKLFWKDFSISIKEGVSSDQRNREKLQDLLRFKSSKVHDKDQFTSLSDYVERMKEDQKGIYYLVAENLDDALRSPHLEYFQEQDIEVLFMLDPADSFLMLNMRDYKETEFSSVDKEEEGDKHEGEAEDEEDSEKSPKDTDGLETVPIELVPLVTRVNQVLGEKVDSVKVSSRLVTSPARLVMPKGALGREFEQVRRYLGEDMPMTKRVFEINPEHELIKSMSLRLEKDGSSPLVDQIITQLFDNALLMDGEKPEVSAMVSRIEAIMSRAMND